MNTPSKFLWSARLLAVGPFITVAAVMALPRAGDRIALGVGAMAALILLSILFAGWRRPPAAAFALAVGALAAIGGQIYLASLDPNGADIPLGGVGALFIGLALLIVGAVNLREPEAISV